MHFVPSQSAELPMGLISRLVLADADFVEQFVCCVNELQVKLPVKLRSQTGK